MPLRPESQGVKGQLAKWILRQGGREEDSGEGEGQVLEATATLITPGIRMKLPWAGWAGQGGLGSFPSRGLVAAGFLTSPPQQTQSPLSFLPLGAQDKLEWLFCGSKLD